MIEDAVGFSIATIPAGAACTVTGVFTSTPGADYWRASVGATNFALGCGGQSWQAPARSQGVTYTNSTGRPIMVSIYSAQSALVTFSVAGVQIAAVSSPYYVTISEVVPPGATYLLTDVSGTLSALQWSELR